MGGARGYLVQDRLWLFFGIGGSYCVWSTVYASPKASVRDFFGNI